MSGSDGNSKGQKDIVPILRTVFSDLPEPVLREMHQGFVALFGLLHDTHVKERESVTMTAPLDADDGRASLNRKV